MESSNRGIQHQPASTHIPQSSQSSCSLFMEQAYPPSGYLQEQLLLPQPQPQPQPHSFPYASTQSLDIQEAIQREIEKSRIREELIVQELTKRRIVESEVRRELMMRREELALRDGGNGSSYGPLSVRGFDSSIRPPTMGPMAEGTFQGEGNVFLHSARMALNDFERDRYNDLLFQRGQTDSTRVSEVSSISEGGKEKVKITLLAKPDEISGLKRKAGMLPPGAGAGADTSENTSDNISRKRPKEEWSCALCKISATSEQGLQEHLEGKKHKAKEAKLRAEAMGKNHSIGQLSKKPVKPIQVQVSASSTEDDAPDVLTLKAPDVSLLPQKASEEVSGTGKLILAPKSSGSESLIKNHVQKSDHLKKKHKFWCQTCQVGADSEKVMDSHKNGKKHLTRLKKHSQTDAAEAGQSNQNEQTLDEAAEPQSNKTVDETTIEDLTVTVSAQPNDGLSTVPGTSHEEPIAC